MTESILTHNTGLQTLESSSMETTFAVYPLSYQDLIDQMKRVIQNPPQNEDIKKALYETARELALVLESPVDTVERISYQPLQLSMAKVGCDLNLFDIMSRVRTDISTDELCDVVDVDPILLSRILRYLASTGMIEEVEENTYMANNITKALAIPGFKAGIEYNFDFNLPCWQLLPSYLSTRSYQNPTNILDTPFQQAFQTHLPMLDWASTQLTHPSPIQNNNNWITVKNSSSPTWLDVLPWEEIHYILQWPPQPHDELGNKLLIDIEPAPIFFVDIGGGTGHQALELKQRYPQFTTNRRIIVEDLPSVFSHSTLSPGIEYKIHNFFEPQLIKNASIYYLRNILHDFPDFKCKVILKNILEAMGPMSVLLVDEIVMPVISVNWRSAAEDIEVMACAAGKERTEVEWMGLFRDEELDFLVMGIWEYDGETGGSVMALMSRDMGVGELGMFDWAES